MSTYASTSDVCYQLGLESVDARRAAYISRLLDAAEAMVNDYCDSEFSLTYRQLECWGTGSRNIFPKIGKILNVIWAGSFPTYAIKITALGAESLVWQKKADAYDVSVNGTRYETTFTYNETIQDVVNWLNNSTSGVVAELQDADLGYFPAWSIYDTAEGIAGWNSTEQVVYVNSASMMISTAFVSEGFLRCNQVIPEGQLVKLIVYSGYADIPAAVREATVLAASMLYQAQDADVMLQSERIGDYAYTNRTATEVTNSIMQTIMPILKPYRQLSL